VDQVSGLSSQRPLVQADISRTDHPVFYGYEDTDFVVKYVNGPILRVGVADAGNVLARYVGGDDAMISGLMTGSDVPAELAAIS
jgi:hypothetical protein